MFLKIGTPAGLDARDTAESLIRQGNLLEDQGKPDAALAKYRQALKTKPDYPRAHLNLGNALLAIGQAEKAVASYRAAILLDPAYAQAHFNCGNALRQLNRLDEAAAAYREALNHAPALPGAHYALGRVLMEQNQPESAIPVLECALGEEHGLERTQWLLARAYNLAAFSLYGLDIKPPCQPDLERAVALCRKAVALDSAYPEARYQLGRLLEQGGALDQAESCYRGALLVSPSYVMARYQLGVVLEKQAKLPEARACFEQVIAIDPEMAHAHAKLGDLYLREGLTREAEACYGKALLSAPDLSYVDVRLGDLKVEASELDEAVEYFQSALKKNPGNIWCYRKIAQVYLNMGRHEEAVDLMRQADRLEIGTPDSQSSKLVALMCSPSMSTEELVAEHMMFGQYCRELIVPKENHSNVRDPERRLRIGYVSGDFVNHVVSYFFEPLLECHHRDQVAVFCYHNNAKSDSVTERLKGKADYWRDIAQLDDAAAASLIQADEIDILVDLSGHSYRNRLLLFAHKPAPVQVTWLGYLATTGMSTMDYRLCDAYTDPPGRTENQHSEQLIRLPNSQWCYLPPIGLPKVNDLPLASKGYLTLGSFSVMPKVNRLTISLWAKVLHALPSSRLLLASVPGSSTAKHLAQEFEFFQISTERLIFRGRMKAEDYFASYGEVDIILDSFPYNGGTTTLDAILMGVPVVTLAGERSVSRGGVSILSNIGLTDLIAATPDDYVRIAQDLARDPARLGELRATLRQRMEKSPLMGMERFAWDLEGLYRRMWRRWVERHS